MQLHDTCRTYTVYTYVRTCIELCLILYRYDKNGQPVACFITSLDAALGWVPGKDSLNVPTVSLHPSRSSDSSAPQILICHDMMGGYNKDKFVQGHR